MIAIIAKIHLLFGFCANENTHSKNCEFSFTGKIPKDYSLDDHLSDQTALRNAQKS